LAAALSAPSAWRPVAELAVADLAASLPDAAAAVEGVEAVLMEIQPTTGDKTLTFQSVVQVGPKLVRGRRPTRTWQRTAGGSEGDRAGRLGLGGWQ
jgi:hypothetical protein